jgi:hypothetical protein
VAVEEAGRQLLHEPEPLRLDDRRERVVLWPGVDEDDAARVAVHRLDDLAQQRLEGLSSERPEEVGDRQIVRHLVFPRVRDYDLDVLASVPACPHGERVAGDLRQLRRDLEADDAAEWAAGGLMDDAALAAPEVHEGVAVRDPDVAEQAR